MKNYKSFGSLRFYMKCFFLFLEPIAKKYLVVGCFFYQFHEVLQVSFGTTWSIYLTLGEFTVFLLQKSPPKKVPNNSATVYGNLYHQTSTSDKVKVMVIRLWCEFTQLNFFQVLHNFHNETLDCILIVRKRARLLVIVLLILLIIASEE